MRFVKSNKIFALDRLSFGCLRVDDNIFTRIRGTVRKFSIDLFVDPALIFFRSSFVGSLVSFNDAKPACPHQRC